MPVLANRSKLRDYLTVTEAAKFVGVSPSTLRNWDRRGKLRPRRHPVNGYRLYTRHELERLLDLSRSRAETP